MMQSEFADRTVWASEPQGLHLDASGRAQNSLANWSLYHYEIKVRSALIGLLNKLTSSESLPNGIFSAIVTDFKLLVTY